METGQKGNDDTVVNGSNGVPPKTPIDPPKDTGTKSSSANDLDSLLFNAPMPQMLANWQDTLSTARNLLNSLSAAVSTEEQKRAYALRLSTIREAIADLRGVPAELPTDLFSGLRTARYQLLDHERQASTFQQQFELEAAKIAAATASRMAYGGSTSSLGSYGLPSDDDEHRRANRERDEAERRRQREDEERRRRENRLKAEKEALRTFHVAVDGENRSLIAADRYRADQERIQSRVAHELGWPETELKRRYTQYQQEIARSESAQNTTSNNSNNTSSGGPSPKRHRTTDPNPFVSDPSTSDDDSIILEAQNLQSNTVKTVATRSSRESATAQKTIRFASVGGKAPPTRPWRRQPVQKCRVHHHRPQQLKLRELPVHLPPLAIQTLKKEI